MNASESNDHKLELGMLIESLYLLRVNLQNINKESKVMQVASQYSTS